MNTGPFGEIHAKNRGVKLTWITSFQHAVEDGSITGILDILEGLSTDHAKTPKMSIKKKALKIIRIKMETPELLFGVGFRLSNSKRYVGEELGAILLAECYELDKKGVTEILYRLADSENWEVREWVASACGEVLKNHFDDFYLTMKDWSHDSSPNVRRAVVVAIKYAGKARDIEIADRLIDLIESLLYDSDPYVKKNLGAFSIGDGLLRYYPAKVSKRIHHWVQIENEQVRWNVAMIFTSAEGTKHVENHIQDINLLLTDTRLSVKRAVKSLMKSIKKRKPEIFRKYFEEGMTII